MVMKKKLFNDEVSKDGAENIINSRKKKNARKDGRSVFSRSFLVLFHSHFEIIVMVVRTEPSIQERRSLVQRTAHAHTYVGTTTISIHPIIISDRQNKRRGALTHCL